jgi:nitroreductase
LNLARRAPSGGFTQGQSFVVVTDLDTRQAVAQICGEEEYLSAFHYRWISEAPVQIVVCVSETEYHSRYREPDKIQPDGTEITWPIPYWFIDAGCSMMLVLLAAVDEGLAAGFAGISEIPALRSLLDIPVEVTPIGVIPLGYPDRDFQSPSLTHRRKPFEAVIHRGRW